MKKKDFKVLTIVGTRPEIIRLSETIKALDRYTNHVLVHTGQNYDFELNEVFFKELGVPKPDYFLDCAGKNGIETVGNVIARVDAVLVKEKPDAFLVLGDTNSCVAAYAAKRHRIPVFHAEAGNRCFDDRVPEEINRRMIDHISDINLVYTDVARQYLLREGIPPDRLIKTGSPIPEVLAVHAAKIENSNIRKTLGLTDEKYFVVSAHREENISDPLRFKTLVKIISDVATTYKIPTIVSTHPRTRKEIEKRKIKFPKQVLLSKPLGLFDYVALQQHAACVISDSGTISEESSILGFPAVNIRDSHERLEAMDVAAVMMGSMDAAHTAEVIRITMAQHAAGMRASVPHDYRDKDFSRKVVRVILSYTPFVRRVVWYETNNLLRHPGV